MKLIKLFSSSMNGSEKISLLNDVRQNPFTGLGKPEPLKHQFKGYWGRRINQEHRLVYKVTPEAIIPLLTYRFLISNAPNHSSFRGLWLPGLYCEGLLERTGFCSGFAEATTWRMRWLQNNLCSRL